MKGSSSQIHQDLSGLRVLRPVSARRTTSQSRAACRMDNRQGIVIISLVRLIPGSPYSPCIESCVRQLGKRQPRKSQDCNGHAGLTGRAGGGEG